MKHDLKKNFAQRGIALLLVLASVALLSGVVVEFAYHSNVTYNLAMNEQDRIQAYYLAKSGINFSKLVIKFDKEAKKVAKDASKKNNKTINIQPLYEMVPLDTALIRALTGMGQGEEGEEGEEGEGEEIEGGEEESALEKGMSLINLQEGESFLDFKGDFHAEVKEEDSKLNLNALYGLTPKQKSYDRTKSVLYHLLASKEFEGMFQDRYRDAKELAQSIVDYVDRDDVYNEPGGQERGREGLKGGQQVKMKNAKLISIEELILVPGMKEEVFQKLKNYLTIYGPDEKIYLCRAEEPLVKAVVIAYTENNAKMEPLKDDNEELLAKATEAVLNNCPDTSAMTKELDKALGVAEDKPPKASTPSSSSKTTPTSKSTPKKTAKNTLNDFIRTDANFFTIVSTGIVGESEVKLKAVLDTSKGNPRQWKELYWRVE